MASFVEPRSVDSDTRIPIVIAANTVLIFLAIAITILRVLARCSIKSFGWDDACAVIAAVSITWCGAMIITMTKYGLGRHNWTVSEEDSVMYAKFFRLSINAYVASLCSVKMTILLQCYRLLSVSKLRKVYIAAMSIVCLWYLGLFLISMLQCIPLKAVWDRRVEGKCISHTTAIWYMSSVFNIVSDFTILILPLPIIWKLQIRLFHKIVLMFIFLLGFLTISISILRMQWLKPQEDVTWWNVIAACWSMAEITSAILCACLLTLKPLVVRLKPLFVRSPKSDSTDELPINHRINDHELQGKPSTSSFGMSDRPSEDREKSDGYGITTWISARNRPQVPPSL